LPKSVSAAFFKRFFNNATIGLLYTSKIKKLNKLPFNIDFKYIEAYSDKKELNTFYALDPYCQAYCIKAIVDVKESVVIEGVVY
jgi:hypothetical protein